MYNRFLTPAIDAKEEIMRARCTTCAQQVHADITREEPRVGGLA